MSPSVTFVYYEGMARPQFVALYRLEVGRVLAAIASGAEVVGQICPNRFRSKQLWYLFVFESWLRNERKLATTGSDDTESAVLMAAASDTESTLT